MALDVLRTISQVQNTPADFVVPPAAEWQLKIVSAVFDGTSAAAAWCPGVQIVGPGNVVVGTFVDRFNAVGAGGSAEVTFGPFLAGVSTPNPISPIQTGVFAVPTAGLVPNAIVGAGTSNLYGMRFVVPVTGTLAGLALFCGTGSGNINVGIYDTATPTRTRLFQTGNISGALGANTWNEVATPNLAIAQNQHIDLCIVADNNVFQMAFVQMNAGNPFSGPLPTGYLVSPQGAIGRLGWVLTATPTIPSTLADVSLQPWGNLPLLLTRIV